DGVKKLITYNGYVMAADKAVLTLPHAFLYQLSPIKYMRAVSRWYLLFALAAVAMVAVGASHVSASGRGRAVATLILAVWIAIEYAPNYPHKADAAGAARESFQRFNSEVVSELCDLIKPSTTVFILGTNGPQNEYLSLYLCAVAACRTFNATGDKTREIAFRQWPAELQEANQNSTSKERRAELLVELLREKVL